PGPRPRLSIGCGQPRRALTVPGADALDLDQVRMQGGPAPQVAHTVAGEDVDPAAAPVEAVPPDPLDNGHARPRVARHLGGERGGPGPRRVARRAVGPGGRAPPVSASRTPPCPTAWARRARRADTVAAG